MNAVSPQNSAGLGAGLAYLPIFLDLRDRPVLLIGGGDGAESKLDLLQRAGARVRRVAGAALEPRHLADAAVAVDASGDPATNRRARSLAREAGVPLNVVDRPALCDFIFPAILDHAPVIVAVSTGGLAPAIARLIRQRLETAIPAGIGRLAMLAARLRAAVATRLAAKGRSAIFWERLFEGETAQLALAGRIDDAATLAESLIAELETGSCMPPISVVDVTSDDPEMLTLRAARWLRTADFILHDADVGEPVLALGRREARRIVLEAADTPAAVLERLKPESHRPDSRVVHVHMAKFRNTGP
ncbi:precorrin-2 dehydrogenase/sirohydrochlorin ferrochelatase family protein [Dongia sp. agr-C8]